MEPISPAALTEAFAVAIEAVLRQMPGSKQHVSSARRPLRGRAATPMSAKSRRAEDSAPSHEAVPEWLLEEERWYRDRRAQQCGCPLLKQSPSSRRCTNSGWTMFLDEFLRGWRFGLGFGIGLAAALLILAALSGLVATLDALVVGS